MKILMTSETYLPRIGGAEIHVLNLLQRLKSLNHNVVFFTNEPGDSTEEIIRVPWSKKNLFSIVKVLWRESRHCDVIHAHYCHRFAFLSGILGRMRGIPVVVTLHGMGLLDHPNVSFINRFSHSLYRYWSLRLATIIISTSDDLAVVSYKYIPKSKVVTILNGYDASLFNPDTHAASEALGGKKIVLTVRRLVPKNGVQYLVEAIPFLAKLDPNIHYFMVGDGGLRSHIEKRIEALGIGSYITMLGVQDNTKVVDYLSRADVVVFPSTAESSSIACAEAMGMRKMIVASAVGGLVELVGAKEERGYLVNLVPWQGSNYAAPASLEECKYQLLAECIHKSLQQSDENEAKRDAAYEYAIRELSWDSVMKKTIDVYSGLVTKK